MTDRILYANTISTTINNSSGTQTDFYTLTTNLGIQTYPLGIFSYDGGNTWNDFGPAVSYIRSVSTPIVSIQARVDSSSTVYFDAGLSGVVGNQGATLSVLLKIALLAPFNNGVVDKSNLYSPKVVAFLSNDPQNPNNYSTYRRIALDNQSSATQTISHGQNQIPNIGFWQSSLGDIVVGANHWASDADPSNTNGIKMDANNLYVQPNFNETFYYRVYKDNT